jgi:ankyrin repeat protein
VLLDAGIEVNARYGNELSALMWAAGHANDVPPREGAAMVRFLLERGAEIDPRDNRGRNALMIAAQRGHVEVVEILIEAGARTDLEDTQGKTAKVLALDAGHREVAAVLDGAKSP